MTKNAPANMHFIYFYIYSSILPFISEICYLSLQSFIEYEINRMVELGVTDNLTLKGVFYLKEVYYLQRGRGG
jgi:hypothetical protein